MSSASLRACRSASDSSSSQTKSADFCCDDRGVVHDVIFNELCQGQVRDASRARYLAIIEAARGRGIDSVILGCTEISLLVDPDALPLPGYDSTAIHADAAVRFALSDGMEQAA